MSPINSPKLPTKKSLRNNEQNYRSGDNFAEMENLKKNGALLQVPMGSAHKQHGSVSHVNEMSSIVEQP